MEIRKNSWHYWFYKFADGGRYTSSTNLCRYFWRVVLGLLLATLCCAVVVGLVGGAGLLFYLHTAASFMVLGAIGVVVGLCFLASHISNKLEDRRWAAGYVKPKPGLLRSYLKAKKDKVCPIVTFVNTTD